MKKVLLTAALVAVFGFAATAQEQGDIRINAGLGIATAPSGADESVTGFGGGVEYVFVDAMSANAEYYVYSKDGVSSGVLGIDYKYYFLTEEFQAFGKVGLSNVSPEVGDSYLGLNLGVGGIYSISDQFGIAAGIDYNLAKPDFPGADPFGLIIKAGVSYSF